MASHSQWYRSPDLSKSAAEDETPFVRINVPGDTSVGTFGPEALLELRSECVRAMMTQCYPWTILPMPSPLSRASAKHERAGACAQRRCSDCAQNGISDSNATYFFVRRLLVSDYSCEGFVCRWAPPNAPGGKKYAAGTLLAAPLADVLKSDWARVTPLFEPSADGSTSLQARSVKRIEREGAHVHVSRGSAPLAVDPRATIEQFEIASRHAIDSIRHRRSLARRLHVRAAVGIRA